MSITVKARKMSSGIGIDVNPAIYLFLLDLVEKCEINDQEMAILLLAFNDIEVRRVSRIELIRAILKIGNWHMCEPIILEKNGPLLTAYFQLLIWIELHQLEKEAGVRLKKIFSLLAKAIGE